MEVRAVTLFAVSVLVVVATIYALNALLWNYGPKAYLDKIRMTQDSALFLEGMVLIVSAALLILGQGGINLASLKAALLGSASDAVFDRSGSGAPGPSEMYRRDAWKPSGFVRLGLIVMCAGIILVLLYFL